MAGAPTPLLHGSGASSAQASSGIGFQVIGAIGGFEAVAFSAAVFDPAEHLHAVPPAVPGIAQQARHAWLCAFVATLQRHGHEDPLQAAAALERHVYAQARKGHAARLALVPSVIERQGAEAVQYNDGCRRVHGALRVNGARLLAKYDDPTVLLHLPDALLEEGTEAEAFRAKKAAEAAHAKHVLEDVGPPKEVEVSVYPCRRCGSGDTELDVKQTRSADEGSTLFWACNACGATGQDST